MFTKSIFEAFFIATVRNMSKGQKQQVLQQKSPGARVKHSERPRWLLRALEKISVSPRDKAYEALHNFTRANNPNVLQWSYHSSILH